MQFVIGMDGGGTTTQAVILQEGKESGRVSAGGINYNSYGKEQIKQHLAEITEKCRELGFPASSCQGACIGAAGISHPAAASFLQKCMEECGFTCKISIIGDHEAALLGGLQGEAGLLLIAGTGSVCLARDKAGNQYKTGGFGHLIDDGGSAYAIGRDILQAVVQAYDGRRQETKLTEAVFEKIGISSIGELVSFVYDSKTGKKEIAKLATLLTEEMIWSDKAAEQIARTASGELIKLIYPAVSFLGTGSYPLLLSGSVLMKNKVIRGLLMEQIAEKQIPVYVTERKKDAAYGAASLFLR